MKNSIILIIFSISLTACLREEYWSAGKEVTKRFDLDDFNYIIVSGQFDVVLVQDTVNYALVTCGKNMLDRVRLIQHPDYLDLQQEPIKNITRSYDRTLLELHFVQLTTIELDNCTRMSSKLPVKCRSLSISDDSRLSELDIAVECTEFRLYVSLLNSGIYKIRGTAQNCGLELQGSAHFRLENLVSDSTCFIHRGIGDCYVNTRRILTGKIESKGALFYRAYPSLQLHIENNNGRIVELR
jgi:hypothetical protein